MSGFVNRRTVASIVAAVWGLLVFAVVAQPIGALIQSNVQELAKEKGWDQFLVKNWKPLMLEASSLAASRWFWALFGLVTGVGITLWLQILASKIRFHGESVPTSADSRSAAESPPSTPTVDDEIASLIADIEWVSEIGLSHNPTQEEKREIQVRIARITQSRNRRWLEVDLVQRRRDFLHHFALLNHPLTDTAAKALSARAEVSRLAKEISTILSGGVPTTATFASIHFYTSDIYVDPVEGYWRTYDEAMMHKNPPVKHFPVCVKSNVRLEKVQMYLMSMNPAVTGFRPFELPLALKSDPDQTYSLIPNIPKLFDVLTWKRGTSMKDVLFHQKGREPISFYNLVSRNLDYIVQRRMGTVELELHLLADGRFLAKHRIAISFDDKEGLKVGNVLDLTANAARVS